MTTSKRKESEREANVGVAKMVASSKKNKDEDPLPFLRKSNASYTFWEFRWACMSSSKMEGTWSNGQDISASESRRD